MDIKKYFSVKNIVIVVVVILLSPLLLKFYKYETNLIAQYRKTQAEKLENQKKSLELINATINDDVVRVNELLKSIKTDNIHKVKPEDEKTRKKSPYIRTEKDEAISKYELAQALMGLAVRSGSRQVFYSLHKQYRPKKDYASNLIVDAALLGDNDIINTLFQDGANLSSKITLEMRGQKIALSPLLAAVESGNIETVKLLLNHGAKITDEDIDQSTKDVRENITQLLIQKGANLNHKTTTYEGPYFSILMQSGMTNIVKKYLNSFKDIDDADSPSIYNRRPIQYAAMYGDLELVKMLQKKGISLGNPNSANWADNFLNSALASNNRKMIDYALAQGFNLNQKDEKGSTPVFTAAQSCSPDLFNYLISKGADISVTNSEGETPAHSAIQGENNEVLKIILAKSNMYQDKKLSEDLLAQAVSYNNIDAFKIFFNKGITVNDKALKRIAREYKGGEYDDMIIPKFNRSEIRNMINQKYPNLLSNYEGKNSKIESPIEKMASIKETAYTLPEQKSLLSSYSPELVNNLYRIEKNIYKNWQTDELVGNQSGLLYIITDFDKTGFIQFTSDPYYVHNLGLKRNLNLIKFYSSAHRALENCFGNIGGIELSNPVNVNFISALVYFKYDATTKTKQVQIKKIQLGTR